MKKSCQNLRKAMRMQGYTIEALAFDIGMSTSNLSEKLNGHHDFRRGDIANICRVLDIPASKIGLVFFPDIPA